MATIYTSAKEPCKCSGSATTIVHPPPLPGSAQISTIRLSPSQLHKYLSSANRNEWAVPLENVYLVRHSEQGV